MIQPLMQRTLICEVIEVFFSSLVMNFTEQWPAAGCITVFGPLETFLLLFSRQVDEVVFFICTFLLCEFDSSFLLGVDQSWVSSCRSECLFEDNGGGGGGAGGGGAPLWLLLPRWSNRLLTLLLLLLLRSVELLESDKRTRVSFVEWLLDLDWFSSELRVTQIS